MRKKKVTEFRLRCRCGAEAPVFGLGGTKHMAHCPGCGSLVFFSNPVLLERLRYGGDVCPHKLEQKPCPGGWTTWCPKCRVRTFYYE